MRMKQEIHHFTQLLSLLQEVDPEFPLQYALCLSLIATHEGLSMTELSEKANMPLSTVSRIIGALSNNRKRGKSYNFIDVRIVPDERRKKQLFLNDQGQTLITRIAKLVLNIKETPSTIASAE